MLRLRSTLALTALLLTALPALGAETVHLTLDASSPQLVPTGLIAANGDRFLVQTHGAVRLLDGRPFNDGWFDAGGLGRVVRADQPFEDGAFGVLLGTFTNVSSADILGRMATFNPPSASFGDELKLALNMDPGDQARLEGAIHVHVTRYTASEATEATFIIDANSPLPLATGIEATDTGQLFMVVGQGAARVISSRPFTQGWFDASGLGRLRRVGQPLWDVPYGRLLGEMVGETNNSLFSIGSLATWSTSTFDLGRELRLGLNMSGSDLDALDGQIVAHVLRIDDVVTTAAPGGDVPDRDAIVSVSNYPNPFNPMTTVSFGLASQQRVRVAIYNAAGELVRTLAHGTYGAGEHELTWDGRDDAGRGQASGTYLLRLETEAGAESRKLALVR
jgi:hypothetical protein